MSHDRWKLFRVPETRYDFLQGLYFLAIAILVGVLSIVLPFLTGGNGQGGWVALGFIVLFGAVAVYYFRRMIWCTLVAFPVLTAYLAWKLYVLEAGARELVLLPEPFAFVYEHLGYAPTAASVPLLGFVCLSVFFHKIRTLTEQAGSSPS